MRIVRLRVTRAPVDQIELRVVGARAPRGPSTVLPRVAVARPRLRARFARRGNRVPPPQLRSGVRIPSIKEPARRPLAARHPGDQHAIGDDWRTGGVVTLLACPRTSDSTPPCPSSCRARRDDCRSNPKELAVVDHRSAARDRRAGRFPSRGRQACARSDGRYARRAQRSTCPLMTYITPL